MTDAPETTAADPVFSDAEVEEFKTVDYGVGRAIGVMLAVLFSLFVPLMLCFWLGVGTVSSYDDDVQASESAVKNSDEVMHGDVMQGDDVDH